MTQRSKKYDLEERTFKFAKNCRDFIKNLSRTAANNEYSKQLIRSSASVSANYIETNEALSRKDYFHRVRISRKEVKESKMWLNLIEVDEKLENVRKSLIQEAFELTRIFGSILEKNI